MDSSGEGVRQQREGRPYLSIFIHCGARAVGANASRYSNPGFAMRRRRRCDESHTAPLSKLMKNKSNGVDIMAGLAANVRNCGRGFR